MLRWIASALLAASLLCILLFLSYSISYFITAGHYHAKIKAITELHKLERGK